MTCTHNESYVLPHNFEKYVGKEYLKSFKCFHLNVRSVKNKESDLFLFFEHLDQEFDVIMLTETWSTDDTNIFRLPSYNTFYLNRSSGRGGGICILVKKALNCALIQDFCAITNDYEFLALDLQNTTLAVCYRPPNGTMTPFLDYLETFFVM